MRNYNEMKKEFIRTQIYNNYIGILKEYISGLKNQSYFQSPITAQINNSSERIHNKEELIHIAEDLIEITENKVQNERKYSQTMLNKIFLNTSIGVSFSDDYLSWIEINKGFNSFLFEDKKRDLLNFEIKNRDFSFYEESFFNSSFGKFTKKYNNDNSSFEEAFIKEFKESLDYLEYDSFLNNNNSKSIECGYLWQVHNYMDDNDSYREIRLTIEYDNNSESVQLILGDDLLDYYGCSSEEMQYYKLYDKNKESLTNIFKDISSIALLVDHYADDYRRYENFDNGILHLGLEKRF